MPLGIRRAPVLSADEERMLTDMWPMELIRDENRAPLEV